MRIITRALLTSGALAAFAVPASAANLLVNGSFEAPVVTGSCCTTTPPTPIPGWTVESGDVNVVTGTYFSNPTGSNHAYDGMQYLDLIGQSGSGVISQTFSTEVGKLYTLTFAYANNPFVSTASGDLSVGDLLDSITHSGSSNKDLGWVVYSQNFRADSTSTTLRFTNTAGGGSQGVYLDGISINSAVPEPAAWMLMILGFGLVGAAMRSPRRREKAQIA